MSRRTWITVSAIVFVVLWAGACYGPNPQPGLTPIPSLAPSAVVTLVPQIQSSASPACPTASASTAVAALGVPLYMQHCSVCHGDLGQGLVGPALRNSRLIEVGAEQTIFSVIADGAANLAMPAWLHASGGPLDSGQIYNVIAYLQTLQGVTAPPTATPLPPGASEPSVPSPSQPGGPGPAAGQVGDVTRGQADFGQFCSACHGPEGIMGISNPGSDDGTVPPLNPIDPALVNADPKVFSTNIDLYIEHGSVPAGSLPQIMMPPYGDSRMLAVGQIADVIAYVMSLNGVHWSK